MLTLEQKRWLLDEFEGKRGLTAHGVYVHMAKHCPGGLQKTTKDNIVGYFVWLGAQVEKRWHPFRYSLVELNLDHLEKIRPEGKPVQSVQLKF
ncbi:MAG: hypothetical protein WC243_02485 [Patescibacteria group bacterium]|jgi:hypothetical protein